MKLMDFVRKVVWGVLGWVWLMITGLASIGSWLGLPSGMTDRERVLAVVAIASALAAAMLLYRCHQIYAQVRAPVTVRKIADGRHHYLGLMLLILDRSNWVHAEQILVLIQTTDDFQTPIALLRVETFTTAGFPQCVVLRSLTNEDLKDYLSDPSRWASMSVVPEIKYRFLEDNADVE